MIDELLNPWTSYLFQGIEIFNIKAKDVYYMLISKIGLKATLESSERKMYKL